MQSRNGGTARINRSNRRPLVDVEVRLVHQTEAAYLVDDECGHRVWVPKSQCQFDPRECGRRGEAPTPYGTLSLGEALAAEKGLI